MSQRKGLTDRLFDTGTRVLTRAAETVLRDPRGQEAMARAIGAAQRGRKRFEDLQARAMRLAGVPGRQEYQDLAKQLARIKRKARELDAKLAANGDPGRGVEEEGRTGGEGPDAPTAH